MQGNTSLQAIMHYMSTYIHHMALVMAIVLFLHIAVSEMATLKFDLATFLAWNKVPKSVLLRGVPSTGARSTWLKPIDGEGSVFPSDCTHFYSICGESDTEHMVYGYILSAEEIATDDARHILHLNWACPLQFR